MTRTLLLPAWSLVVRELVRFVRQPARVVGIIASPILFWFVIGSGLGDSFQLPTAPPSIQYLEYFFPGTIVLIILFTSIFASISIIEDRREGFLQGVLVAPIPRSALVLGKVTGVALLAVIQGFLFLIAAPFILTNISLSIILKTTIILFLIALGLAGLGFALAWRMDSTQGFHAIMNLFLIPLWLLSGSLFPQAGAAGWISALMTINPLTYGVAAVRSILYDFQGDYTKDMPDFILCILITIGFAGLMFVLSLLAARQREQGTRLVELSNAQGGR
ncbi:MAG TPA: ABC transporter permease [Bacteroidota bacterium]|nr:ABC transporter permease [Bacteroidota bacterium]